jgi:putative peptidoglycan lipid II flippase
MGIVNVESYKRGIILSTVLNVFNKGLTFLGSITIAYYFGSQTTTDIFFYIYSFAVLVGSFSSALNSSVLIPESMKIRTQESERTAMQFLNIFIWIYISFGLLVMIPLFYDPAGSFSILSKFDLHDLRNNIGILYMGIPLIVLITISTLLTDILASYRFFTIPTIVGIINGVSYVVFIFIFHSALHVKSAILGLIISYTLNILMLVSLMYSKLRWNFRPGPYTVKKSVWKNIGFAQAGNITTVLYSYAPYYFFSGLNAGVITTLTFAQQISNLPTSLFTNQFTSVAAIKFNELHSKKDFSELNAVYQGTNRFLLFVMTPISGIFFLFPEEIISFLVHRGAFDADAVKRSAEFLRYLGLLVPMLIVNALVSRLFMAYHKIKESFWYQVSMNVMLVIFMAAGIRYFAEYGYLCALIITYILNVVLIYFLISRILPSIDYGKILQYFYKIIALNVAVTAVLFYTKQFWAIGSSSVVSLMAGSIIYLLLIVLSNYFLNIDSYINTYFAQLRSKISNLKKY